MSLFQHKNKRGQLRTTLLASAVGIALSVLPQISTAATKVVGYIPAAKDMRAVIDRVDLSRLTHINLSFANPNASGAILSGGNPVCMDGASAADINYVVQKAHAGGVKVLVSLAGGVLPQCSGSWSTLLQPATRQTVVNNIINFSNTFNLDGVDVDIEGELLTAIDQANNYTPFIQALDNALPGKLLTAATASYNGGMVPIASLPYFDFVNIMSYDNIYGAGNQGNEHASYAFAQSNIDTWQRNGLTKEQLVLGVPVYGYGFGSYAGEYTFSGILSQFGTGVANQDVIGTRCVGCSYITYNGLPTIRSKAKLAIQEGSGVMLWELSQDAAGSNSILGAIAAEVGPLRGSSSSASSIKSSSSVSSIKSSSSSVISSSSSIKASSSSIKSNSSSSVAVSSSSVASGQQCNWWGTYYALCKNINSGWGWENNKDCVGVNTCATLPAPYGVVGAASSSSVTSSIAVSSTKSSVVSSVVASSVKSSVASSSVVSSSVKSSSSSSTAPAFTKLIEAEAYTNMSGIQLEATKDAGLGQNVGYIDAGDWLAYANVTFPTTGTYRVEYRVASVGGSTLSLDLNGGAIQLSQVALPSTGDWQAWTTVSHTVQINAGTYSVGLYAPAGNWNINWFKFTKI